MHKIEIAGVIYVSLSGWLMCEVEQITKISGF